MERVIEANNTSKHHNILRQNYVTSPAQDFEYEVTSVNDAAGNGEQEDHTSAGSDSCLVVASENLQPVRVPAGAESCGEGTDPTTGEQKSQGSTHSPFDGQVPDQIGHQDQRQSTMDTSIKAFVAELSDIVEMNRSDPIIEECKVVLECNVIVNYNHFVEQSFPSRPAETFIEELRVL